MGYRPSTSSANQPCAPNVPTQLADQLLGEAYDTIKIAVENISAIQAVGAQVTGLALIAEAMTQLQYLITQIDNLQSISDSIADITPIVTNINQLLAIHSNMADLIQLHDDLPALIEVHENLAPFIAELTTVAGMSAELSAVAANEANITLVASLETAINGMPSLVAAAQQAAQDAQDAANSINLPIIVMPADAGKELYVDPDLGTYALRTPIAFMLPSVYDPANKAADAFSVDNHVSGTTNKVFTASNQSKLAGIATNADVTAAGNVGTAVNGTTAKTALDDTDHVTIINSIGNVLAKITWANIKASLKASAAEVYASTVGRFLSTDMIATASNYVALANSATPVLNWEAGINRELIISQNTEIQNPLNGRPGTHRSILVKGASATPRSVLFDDQFKGDLPEIDDCNDTKWYDITIKCISPTHFTAVAHVARSI